MAYTDQATYDSLSFHAVTAPVQCHKMTIQELVTDAAPTAYKVAAPTNTNTPFLMNPMSLIVFDAGIGAYWQVGNTVGYIQPLSGTVTFSRLCE